MPPTDLAHSKDEQELSGLMRKAQSGDREAYRALLEKVNALLISFVTNSLGKPNQDSVSDVVQEALLGIHAKRHTYDPDRYFLPWLYAIARYKVIDHFRFKKNHASTLSLETPGVWEQVTSSDADQSAHADTATLLKDLPQKQRNLLKLVKLDGLSIQEASLKTGYSTSDVKVSLHRGIKLLQKRLKERSGNERQ